MLHVIWSLLRQLKKGPGTPQRVLLALIVVLLYGAIGFYCFESEQGITLETAFWWSVVTMSTVGYGDVYPTTIAGRWLVAVPVMVVGIGVLGYALGALASLVVERRNKELSGMVDFTSEDHVLICHYPSEVLIMELIAEIRADQAWANPALVLLSDHLNELTPALRDAGVFFVQGSPSREEALIRANVSRARAVLVLSRNPGEDSTDNHTLGAVVTIRSCAPDVYIVAECAASENLSLLRNAGANEVVGVSGLTAELLVQSIQDPGINEVVSELLSNTSGHQIYIHPITGFSGDFAAAVSQLKPGPYAALAVIDRENRRQFAPAPSTAVGPGDRLLVVGAVRPDPL